MVVVTQGMGVETSGHKELVSVQQPHIVLGRFHQ